MKKKEFIFIGSILTIILLVAVSTSAGILQTKKTTESSPQIITMMYQFSPPEVGQKDEYATIHVPESTGYRTTPGEPILPLVMTTVMLPFGATITDFSCTVSGLSEVFLRQKIRPASAPIPFYTGQQPRHPLENSEIYSKDQFFPESWYSYRLTGGLNKENILSTFLTVQLHPVRYNPTQDCIQSIQSISITITYQPPTDPFPSPTDSYDMVIICYDPYASLLEPLITHKNSHGIKTKLVTLENISSGTYFTPEGRDKPEQIKYFIKNAKETWNITYVMLVGSFRQLPGRYSNLQTDAGGLYEELHFACDLYFADLYTANGSFSSWDTDDDDLFAEWPWPEWHQQEDIVDMVPDVHVGRLACMFKTEVKTMVDKIITYENTTQGSEWFNRMVVVGGDTFDKNWEGGTNYNEGEVATDKALEYMPQYAPIRIWASLQNLTPRTIHSEISTGCGFLYFCGHGSPQMWATHTNEDNKTWVGNYKNTNILILTNRNKYPILMVGGCHNSEYDVAPINFIKGLLEEKMQFFSQDPLDYGSFWKYKWVPECWSWVFVKARGGAIASMGSSGYGGVNIGDGNNDGIPDCIQGADGWFEVEFFRLYNQETLMVLGETYSNVVTGYVHTFPVDTNRYDAKIVQTHVLLGDPSLKIGGYP